MDVGIEISVVLGIAMSESCGRKSFSIVIDYHRAEAYLVASVPVDVCNGIVVIAIAIPRT